MKFEKRSAEAIPFSLVKIGDVFRVHHEIYLRISSAILNDKELPFEYANAVNLTYQRVAFFADDEKVFRLQNPKITYEVWE